MAAFGSYTYVEDSRSPDSMLGQPSETEAAPSESPSPGPQPSERVEQGPNTFLAELNQLPRCEVSDLGPWALDVLGTADEIEDVALDDVATSLPLVRRDLPLVACHITLGLGEGVVAWEAQGAEGALVRVLRQFDAPDGGLVPGAPDLPEYVEVPLASGQAFAGQATGERVDGSVVLDGRPSRLVAQPFGFYAAQFAELAPAQRVSLLRTTGVEAGSAFGVAVPLPEEWMACTGPLAATRSGFAAVGIVEACRGTERVEVSIVEVPPATLPAGGVRVGPAVVIPLAGEPGDVEAVAEEVDRLWTEGAVG
ncbi:hypothetical protein [Euzebya tangerina]|uniref:hypothetical protein n=1 Tax=Euzebya tangerina TaxID=591198 RepID=UPI0013C2DC10|nr:hypothetical protein [Euzebya tangerina]